jgi:hypothetical protein
MSVFATILGVATPAFGREELKRLGISRPEWRPPATVEADGLG